MRWNINTGRGFKKLILKIWPHLWNMSNSEDNNSHDPLLLVFVLFESVFSGTNTHLIRRPPDLRRSLGPVQPARRPSDLLGADWRLALRSRRFAYDNRFVVMGTVAVSRFRPRGAAAVAALGCRIHRLAVRWRRVGGTVVRLRVVRGVAAVCSRDHRTAAGFIHAVFYKWDRKKTLQVRNNEAKILLQNHFLTQFLSLVRSCLWIISVHCQWEWNTVTLWGGGAQEITWSLQVRISFTALTDDLNGWSITCQVLFKVSALFKHQSSNSETYNCDYYYYDCHYWFTCRLFS